MNNSLDTSFIPQQPLLKVEGSLRRREPVNIALILALVIFFTSLTVAMGFYIYKASIEKRVTTLEKQLESKEANLKIGDIDRYKTIDARLSLAKRLLQEHVAFSGVLTLLEKVTSQDIGWTKLSYFTDQNSGLTALNLNGEAPNYSAVYAQAESWRHAQPSIKSVEIGMPSLDFVSGIVTFDAKLTIDEGSTNYARLIKEDEVSLSEQETTPPGSATEISSPQTP
ncbi:MAG TPA: hypothetical protein VJJ02_05320 [Candidatus Paceibacterota bacterium]